MSIPMGPGGLGTPAAATPCRLTAPTGLSPESWEVIWSAEQRMARAEAAGDRPLIVGCAKELVEAVAKAVVAWKFGPPGAGIKFGPLITQAHRALDRQPGEGLATDGPTRDLAQATKILASQLGLLRNELGTGHARAALSEVAEESLELAVTSALLWSRWALRRFEHAMASSLEPLIADLDSGAIFHAGDLTHRLTAAGLSGLTPDEARRLGRAVGQRAASGTFVVMGDGVGACVDSDDVQSWPVPYREGVALGLLLDRYGYLHAHPTVAARLAGLLSVMPDPLASVTYVVEELDSAPLQPSLHPDPAARWAIVSALDEAGRAVQVAVEPWQRLRNRFAEPGSGTG